MYYKIINRKKKLVTIAADIIGYALWTPINFFKLKKRQIPHKDIKEVLVVRTAYIGDVVMTLPILKPLKELYPDARITFLTGSGAAEVLLNNPYIDEVLVYDAFWFYPRPAGQALKEYLGFVKALRGRRYDLVIEARGDIRDIALIAYPGKSRYRLSYAVGGGGYLLTHVVPYPGLKHKVEYHMDMVRHLGCKTEVADWDVYLTKDEQGRVNEIMERHGIREPFIAVHPGSRLPLKRWPAGRYGSVCDRLMEESGMPVVVFGSTSEKPVVEEMTAGMRHKPISLAGEVGLREMAGIISRAALFICNDSAPMHIAAAMKTPTAAIFGPSKSVETGPYGKMHRVVEKVFPCRVTCDENSCSYSRFNACMGDITVEDVMCAASELLKVKRTR